MAFKRNSPYVDGIGHFLSDNFLRVPSFQRSYAWEKEHVEDYWNDIKRAMNEGDGDYFVGSLVLSEVDKEDVLEVVDGQQRLATTTMILGAVRDYLVERRMPNTDKWAGIYQKYLLSPNEETGNDEPRLTLNADDHSYFESLVVMPAVGEHRVNPLDGNKRPKWAKESHKHIATAAKLVRGFIFDYVRGDQPADAVNGLRRLVTYIKTQVKVICIVVASHDDAYTIFETLNARGLELSKADLLKNHLLRTAKRRQAEVESKWAAMTGALETVSKRDVTADFIRYYWIATEGHVRVKDLYRAIKDHYTGPADSVAFAERLASASVLYAAILNSDHPRWGEFGEGAETDLSNLIMLGIDRLRPITLAVALKFDKHREVQKALYYLVCASVRIIIASPAPGQVFEQRIAEVAPKISKGTIKTAQALAEEMNQSIVPGNAEFEAEFRTAHASQTHLQKYYLRALDNTRCGRADPARVKKGDIKDSVEHIIPQNPEMNWPHLSSDMVRAYLTRIGNLALLSKKENEAAGNHAYRAVKRSIYREHKTFQLTNDIAEVDHEWSISDVERRQEELAAYAVDTWSIKVPAK